MHSKKPYRRIGTVGRIAAWYAESTGKGIAKFRRLAENEELTKEWGRIFDGCIPYRRRI